MARFLGMTSICVALMVVMATMAHSAAGQTVHMVGDGNGWTVLGAGSYTTWATGKQFAVGDVLTFNFQTNEHDVLRVTKASYDACTSTNSIGDVITSGPVNMTLDSTGDHYYICTVGRHCQLGQKLAITVSSTTAVTPGGAPQTPSTTPSPSGTPEACAPTPEAPVPSGPSGSTTSTPSGTSGIADVPPPPPGSSSTSVMASAFASAFGITLALFV